MGAATMAQTAQMNDPVEAPAPQRIEPVTAENIKVEDDDDTLSYFAKLAEAELKIKAGVYHPLNLCQ